MTRAGGMGGVVASHVRMALRGHPLPVYTVIAGLGGRSIIKPSLHKLFEKAGRDDLEDVSFLDLNWDAINREVARMKETRRSGPHAENILRDVGPTRKVV